MGKERAKEDDALSVCLHFGAAEAVCSASRWTRDGDLGVRARRWNYYLVRRRWAFGSSASRRRFERATLFGVRARRRNFDPTLFGQSIGLNEDLRGRCFGIERSVRRDVFLSLDVVAREFEEQCFGVGMCSGNWLCHDGGFG